MFKYNLQRLCSWLAKPILLHWTLPYLMALIALGTVAQRTIGLYDSQRLFLSSFIVWFGWLPLPGGRTVTAFLLVSLLAKLIIASPWRKAKSGIFIAHLGVLLLLLGGLVTAAFSVEGYMALEKNQSASRFYDYHQRALTISKNDAILLRLPLESLSKGQRIAGAAFPFAVAINELCHNCTMAMRSGNAERLQGPAQKVMLDTLAGYLEDERNLAGIELSIFGASPDADGTYIAFEPMEKQPTFTIGKDRYTIALGREAYALPFSLQLLEAQKEMHPGTSTPRSYRSVVMLSDGALQERAVITMNHPLRYKGYTVYQASFNGEEGNDPVQSVSFAIVQNSGRVFPYVASGTLCLGLLIHLGLRLPALIRRKSHAL